MNWLWLVVVLLASALGYFLGQEIALSEQWPYFEALRTTSSIVFGVMGALLAIVYPEVVKQGFRATAKMDLGNAGNLRLVVDALAHSALLLLVLVLSGPVFVWVSTLFAKSEYVSHIQGASFGALCMLTVWQGWILVLVLRPLDLLRVYLETSSTKAAAKRRIHEFGPGEKRDERL
jgi:hypothetical protein